MRCGAVLLSNWILGASGDGGCLHPGRTIWHNRDFRLIFAAGCVQEIMWSEMHGWWLQLQDIFGKPLLAQLLLHLIRCNRKPRIALFSSNFKHSLTLEKPTFVTLLQTDFAKTAASWPFLANRMLREWAGIKADELPFKIHRSAIGFLVSKVPPPPIPILLYYFADLRSTSDLYQSVILQLCSSWLILHYSCCSYRRVPPRFIGFSASSGYPKTSITEHTCHCYTR